MVKAEFQNLRNVSFVEIAFSVAAWKVLVDEQMGDICSSADAKTIFIHTSIFRGDKVPLVFLGVFWVSTVMGLGRVFRSMGLLCVIVLREVSLGKMFRNESARCFLVDTSLSFKKCFKVHQPSSFREAPSEREAFMGFMRFEGKNDFSSGSFCLLF